MMTVPWIKLSENRKWKRPWRLHEGGEGGVHLAHVQSWSGFSPMQPELKSASEVWQWACKWDFISEKDIR